MIDEEILQKVIEKAEKNGFDMDGILIKYPKELRKYNNHTLFVYSAESSRLIHYMTIIFNHDFAKAFFGEQEVSWKYHLQQMVLDIEPLKYLENFL